MSAVFGDEGGQSRQGGQTIQRSQRGGHDSRSSETETKLHVGDGVSIKGATVIADSITVDGTLEGDISVGMLFVGATGTIKGRINVSGNAEICGKVFDRLDVRGLLLVRSGSRVEATLSCGMVQIEQGASITGGISSADYQVRANQQFSPTERRQQPAAGHGAAASARPDPALLDMPSPIAASG